MGRSIDSRRGGLRRLTLTLSILPVSVPGLVMLPSVDSSVRPEPVETRLQTLSLTTESAHAEATALSELPEAEPDGDGRAKGSHQAVAATRKIKTKPFRLVAVTWISAESDVVAWIRSRNAGTWSQWYELPEGDDHAPDPGTAEADDAREGTDPLLVAESDAVQVRVATADGTVPDDLRLDLVDPGESPADETAGVPSGSTAAAAPGRPVILTRAQWGADESLREPGPPAYGAVRGAFVHHTVNANSYTAADVPAILRGIYAYHVKSRGWRDIGYNFLVDRFGRIWEGRFGGVDRAVIGAHTAGYNDVAFAMSAIGTYTTKVPEPALISAYQRLFAWKFAIHGVDPRNRVNYHGELWPAVAGHRDAADTECPGQALYARLPTIRAGVITTMYSVPDVPLGRDISNDGYPDVLARRRSDGSLWLWEGNPDGGFGSLTQAGVRWHVMSAVVMPGDWNGDGTDDVIARTASDGSLWLYTGQPSGGITRSVQIGNGWNVMTAIVAPSDLDGDGRVDLIGRRVDGSLWLYGGNGEGRFRPPTQIGHGWQIMSVIVGPGDFDGDGRNDLLARKADGSLWLYPGRGSGGGFLTARQVGHGWNQFDRILGVGDVDQDRHMDVMARQPSGSIFLYPGNGVGGFGRPTMISTGWAGFDLLI
jgi:N-acetylmuramoyl-L-alanine amidase/FG-GAP-like repeat